MALDLGQRNMWHLRNAGVRLVDAPVTKIRPVCFVYLVSFALNRMLSKWGIGPVDASTRQNLSMYGGIQDEKVAA